MGKRRDKAIEALKLIIAKERAQGCPMAYDALIEPAIRRWRSYPRRHLRTKSKDKTTQSRAHDLAIGWVDEHEAFGVGYDRNCLDHLAASFAEVLSGMPDPD